MDAVGTHAGNVVPWTQIFLQPSALYVGETSITSSEGGQQGLFFSLAIQEALRSCPKTLAHFWYLYDDTLIGDFASLRVFMMIIILILID